MDGFSGALNPLRRIAVSDAPFRHVIIDDFLNPSFANRVQGFLRRKLAEGLYDRPASDRFVRGSIKNQFGSENYDAYIYVWPDQPDESLRIFYDKEFRDFAQGLFEVPLTGEVVGSFHHHLAFSRSGWPHTDFEVCNFHRPRLDQEMNPFKWGIPYQGVFHRAEGIKHVVRSVALLYYLGNEEWREGDGGETGLFQEESPFYPSRKIEPVSNRALLFEVTPASFHSYIRTNRGTRSSIAFWFHSEIDEVVRRFGARPQRLPKDYLDARHGA